MGSERWTPQPTGCSAHCRLVRLASPAARRTIAFALSFFHATILERKKFGVGNLPGARSGIGWNMVSGCVMDVGN